MHQHFWLLPALLVGCLQPELAPSPRHGANLLGPPCTTCALEDDDGLLTNGGFDSLGGWVSKRGTWTTAATDALDGDYLEISGTNALMISDPIPYASGTVLSLEAWTSASGFTGLSGTAKVILFGYPTAAAVHPSSGGGFESLQWWESGQTAHYWTNHDWTYWADHRVVLGADTRAVRVAIVHQNVDSGSTTRVDRIRLSEVDEIAVFNDPGFQRQRIYSDAASPWPYTFATADPATEFFLNNEEWLQTDVGNVPYARDTTWADGVVTVNASSGGDLFSAWRPYDGRAIRAVVRHRVDGFQATGDVALWLEGETSNGTRVQRPMILDQGTTPGTGFVLSQPAWGPSGSAFTPPELEPFPDAVVKVRVHSAPTGTGTVSFDHISLIVRTDTSWSPIPDPVGGPATVTVDLNSGLSGGYENPIQGASGSYAASALGRVSRDALVAMAPRPLTTAVDIDGDLATITDVAGPADPDTYAPTLQRFRLFSIFEIDNDYGNTIVNGGWDLPQQRWLPLDDALEFLDDLGYDLLLDVGSPPSDWTVAPWVSRRKSYTQTPLKPAYYQDYRNLCERLGEHMALGHVNGNWDLNGWALTNQNEPNAGHYFEGTVDQYLHQYDLCAEGFRVGLFNGLNGHPAPDLSIGGPTTTGGGLTDGFAAAWLDHCVRGTKYATGAPVSCDILDVHSYSSGGKGHLSLRRHLVRVATAGELFSLYGASGMELQLSELNGVAGHMRLELDDPRDVGSRSHHGVHLIRAGLDGQQLGLDRAYVHPDDERSQRDQWPHPLGTGTCQGEGFTGHGGLVTASGIPKAGASGIRILGEIPQGTPVLTGASDNHDLVEVNAWRDPTLDETWILLTNYDDRLYRNWGEEVNNIGILSPVTQASDMQLYEEDVAARVDLVNLSSSQYLVDVLRLDADHGDASTRWREEGLECDGLGIAVSVGGLSGQSLRDYVVAGGQLAWEPVTTPNGTGVLDGGVTPWFDLPLPHHGAALVRITPAPNGSADRCDGIDRDGGGWDVSVPADCPTIQMALDAAASSGVVGTVSLTSPLYTETLDFTGAEVRVVGVGAWMTDTVIQGAHAGPVVTFQNGESRDAGLENLTIQRGTGRWDGVNGSFGGGVYVNGSDPTLKGVLITNNTAQVGSGFGGGLYLFDSEASLHDVFLWDNVASYYGGGASIQYSPNALAVRLDARGNRADVYGGGVQVSGDLAAENWAVAGNLAWCGGGVFFEYGGPATLLDHPTLAGNRAVRGGAMCVQDGELVVRDAIISSNRVTDSGSLLGAFNAGEVEIQMADIYGNIGTPTYLIGGSQFFPVGPFGATDPQLILTPPADPTAWDLHPLSPAVLSADVGAYGGPGGSW